MECRKEECKELSMHHKRPRLKPMLIVEYAVVVRSVLKRKKKTTVENKSSNTNLLYLDLKVACLECHAELPLIILWFVCKETWVNFKRRSPVKVYLPRTFHTLGKDD